MTLGLGDGMFADAGEACGHEAVGAETQFSLSSRYS